MAQIFDTVKEVTVKLISSARWYDVFDIVVMTLALYLCIRMFRNTRVIHLVKGLVLLGITYFIVSTLKMSLSTFVFSRLFSNIVVVLIILFQPEIRHAIESFGRSGLAGISILPRRSSSLQQNEMRNCASSVAKAAGEMSEKHIGALMVLEGRSPLGEIISTGSIVDAQISTPVIENIFFPNSPLHDGAMIIRNNRIHAAACILPLTENKINRSLGTRHRAALGISEESDALVVVVSEETGSISVAKGGTLTRDLTQGELLDKLTDFLDIKSQETSEIKRKKRRKNNNEK